MSEAETTAVGDEGSAGELSPSPSPLLPYMQPCPGGCSALGHEMLTCVFSKVSAPSALLCRGVGLS